jgi:hypothetical protein
VSVEALFDFDRLVEQLGAETPPGVQALEAFDTELSLPAASSLPAPEGADAFARLESDLREREARAAALRSAEVLSPEDAAALAELERWLEALRSAQR